MNARVTHGVERTSRLASLEAVVWLLVYVVGLGAAQACGFRMAVPYFYYQVLSRQLLEHRLCESLWNLHAPPPLLDLALGVALKLSRASGVSVEGLLLLLNGFLGMVVVFATLSLLRRLVIRPALRSAVMLLLLLDPSFYLFLGIFSYTFYELVLLMLAALAAHRFGSSPLCDSPHPGSIPGFLCSASPADVHACPLPPTVGVSVACSCRGERPTQTADGAPAGRGRFLAGRRDSGSLADQERPAVRGLGVFKLAGLQPLARARDRCAARLALLGSRWSATNYLAPRAGTG